jgi:hypothetical protein
MFTAYFDAAGNGREQPFIVVSGYIANFLQWKSLEVMWNSIHKEHGLSPPFHMAEFIAATANPQRYEKQKNARPDYVAVGYDMPRAERFLRCLCLAEQTIAVLRCFVCCEHEYLQWR